MVVLNVGLTGTNKLRRARVDEFAKGSSGGENGKVRGKCCSGSAAKLMPLKQTATVVCCRKSGKPGMTLV